ATSTLSLGEAVTHALCANPKLRTNLHLSDVAAAQKERAQAAFKPSVFAKVGTNRTSESQRTDSYSVGVSWLLYDFGERAAQLTAAQAGVDRAHASTRQEAQVLAFEVAQAFFGVQAGQSS